MPNIIDIRDSYRATIAFVPTRVELPILLNERRLFGCGVEVGVQQGEYSETLLRYWRGMHLISVDPWREDAPENYIDIANVLQPTHEQFFQTTTKRLARYGTRSSVQGSSGRSPTNSFIRGTWSACAQPVSSPSISKRPT